MSKEKKMRLIDADELKTLSYEVLVDTGNPNRADGLSAYNGLVEDDIDLAPTVEAIPIEWIEKKIAYIKEYPDSDDISDFYQLKVSEVWGWLLEDWREENESIISFRVTK